MDFQWILLGNILLGKVWRRVLKQTLLLFPFPSPLATFHVFYLFYMCFVFICMYRQLHHLLLLLLSSFVLINKVVSWITLVAEVIWQANTHPLRFTNNNISKQAN